MRVVLLMLLSVLLFSAKVSHNYWERGLDFETYLLRHKISTDIIDSLDKDDIQLISEIDHNRRFYEMVASNGLLLQTLIPVGEELQLHLFRTPTGYKIEVIPVSYQKKTRILVLKIEKDIYDDIIKQTKNKELANEFGRLMKNSIDFKNIQRQDKLVIVYDQKIRLGYQIGIPDIKVMMLESHSRKHYIFKHTDGKYYDEYGRELIKKCMGKPLKKIEITSEFTNRRFHPILKRWKAHLGTDFRAKVGTPIFAVADGKVLYAGWKGANGNFVKLKHRDGYTTIYSHLSKIKVNCGEKIKEGEIIGYVGNTGRSTGPHLHFGVYRNGRAINPMGIVRFSPEEINGDDRADFFRRKNKYTQIINKISDRNN